MDYIQLVTQVFYMLSTQHHLFSSAWHQQIDASLQTLLQ